MARIRPRGPMDDDPDTVAGRPLAGEPVPPPDDELDDLAGVEAFAPSDDGDFGRAFARHRRDDLPDGEAQLARTSLGVAVVVLLAGILTVLFGVVEDEDDGRADDVATLATTSTTSASGSTTSTASTAGAGSTMSTTSGFGPGTTATTVRRTTITTVRPSTTLPQATATTTPATTPAPANQPLRVEITVEGDLKVGQSVVVNVFTIDPDAVPTDHCQVITINGSTILEDPCEPEDCPSDPPPVADNGGDRTLRFDYTFTTASQYTIEVYARSGLPECGNPYADEATGSLTVTVT